MPATNPSLNPAPVAPPHSLLQQFLLRGHRDEPVPTWIIFPVIYAFVLLTHLPLMRLPYFWDEAGYYIPAAFDFFRTGSLIPYSTLTNAHPPLPAIYLATWWKISGFTPVVTRLATCLVAAFALTAVFALVRRLMNTTVAVATTLLTALYPVWFTQSTLAQADIYAAAGTMWALVVRIGRAALCATRMDRRRMVLSGRALERNCHCDAVNSGCLARVGDPPQACAGPRTLACRVAICLTRAAACAPGMPTIFIRPDISSATHNMCATTPCGPCTCSAFFWRSVSG